MALAAFPFSAYLLDAQLGPIDAVCDWRVANDAVAALLVPVAALRLR